MAYEDKYLEFEQYIRATESEPKERAELWQTAIGLQKVDGLSVSDYLIETAKKHIEDAKPQNAVLESPKRQNDVLETSEMLTGKLTLKEMAVIRLITTDPKISIASITTKTGLSRRTVDRIISTLKEKGLLTRQGAKNNATWIFTMPKS